MENNDDEEEEAFPPWDYGKLMNYKFLLSCSSPEFYFGNNSNKLLAVTLPSHQASTEYDEEQKRTHTIPLNPPSIHPIPSHRSPSKFRGALALA